MPNPTKGEVSSGDSHFGRSTAPQGGDKGPNRANASRGDD